MSSSLVPELITIASQRKKCEFEGWEGGGGNNKGNNHTSEIYFTQIYFIIKKEGCSQRCKKWQANLFPYVMFFYKA